MSFSRNYDKENIKGWLLQAKQNLKQLREFIVSCEKQLELTKNTKFNKMVVIEYAALQGFQFYLVGCHNIPEIEEQEDIIYPVFDIKRFDGGGEMKAMQYAKELAQKHKCEIKTIGVDKHV